MEDITDADYVHTESVCKYFELKSLCEYHNLYVQSKTLLLADIFQNFRNMCFKRYELLYCTRSSMTSSFQKD